MSGLVNPNPVVHDRKRTPIPAADASGDFLDNVLVYDIIRDIKDPEHPYTLEELRVVDEENIEVTKSDWPVIRIQFTPTVPHCSLVNHIGLCIHNKLSRNLPERSKIDISVTTGSHADELAVNKQINDKERLLAAMENPTIRAMVDECIEEPGY